MLFNIRPNPMISAPTISFQKAGSQSAGNMLYATVGDQWEAAFLESGTIRFNGAPGDVDIFLVANGHSGNNPTAPLDDGIGKKLYRAGEGGDGGNWLLLRTSLLKAGVDYVLTIGTNTTLVGGSINLTTANGNAGSSGGTRGLIYMTNVGISGRSPSGNITQHAGKGADGVFAYNDAYDRIIVSQFKSKRFCAGGGGGDAFYYGGGVYETADNSGGATGGGHGSWYRTPSNIGDASAGGANSGAGGGGGRVCYEGFDTLGAAGGSGVAFVRKHLEA